MILNAAAAIRKAYFEVIALTDGIGFDGQGPSTGHRIDGIQGQV